MHKVHLLCLLARGRVIDKACNDPLIQVHYIGIHLYHFKLLMFQNDEISRFFTYFMLMLVTGDIFLPKY